MQSDVIMCKCFSQLLAHGDVTECKMHIVTLVILSLIMPTSDFSFECFVVSLQFV